MRVVDGDFQLEALPFRGLWAVVVKRAGGGKIVARRNGFASAMLALNAGRLVARELRP